MRAGLGPELGDDKWAMGVREKNREKRKEEGWHGLAGRLAGPRGARARALLPVAG
jgi:hypothetical protein